MFRPRWVKNMNSISWVKNMNSISGRMRPQNSIEEKHIEKLINGFGVKILKHKEVTVDLYLHVTTRPALSIDAPSNLIKTKISRVGVPRNVRKMLS
jgi:hypothetical protein